LERLAQAFRMRVKINTDIRAVPSRDAARLQTLSAAAVVGFLGEFNTLPTVLDSANPFPELLSRM